MNKLKLPIIIVLVLAAGVAGLYVSGIIGGPSAAESGKKYPVEPVPLGETFTVNLADSKADRYLVLGIAVQLEAMDKEHWETYTGANAGGHGGSTEAPGPAKVAAYPKFRDAVYDVASRYQADFLRTPEGRRELKATLLDRFAEIAEIDAAEYKARPDDGTHEVTPPYHVAEVSFTQFVVS